MPVKPRKIVPGQGKTDFQRNLAKCKTLRSLMYLESSVRNSLDNYKQFVPWRAMHQSWERDWNTVKEAIEKHPDHVPGFRPKMHNGYNRSVKEANE